jgi:hypothetical protein
MQGDYNTIILFTPFFEEQQRPSITEGHYLLVIPPAKKLHNTTDIIPGDLLDEMENIWTP